MRNIFPLLIIMTLLTCCRQENYFKILNDEKTYSEQEFLSYLTNSNKALPEDYSQTPVIYNKLFKGDSIVNYVYFKKVWWGDKEIDPKSFEIIYRQDSAFLFLDRKIPYFNLPDLSGDMITSDHLSGKPTLINFWFTRCGGCILEIPELNNLVDKYKEKVNFIAFSLDDTDTVKKFLANIPFNFRHIPNASEYITKDLMINGFPLNYILDKDGYVREIKRNMPTEFKKYSGSSLPKLSNREFDKILEELLSQ